MPRGTPRTEDGRLNGNQARELARRIRSERSGWRVEPVAVAQGLQVVEVTMPDARRFRLRNESDWARLRRMTQGA